MPPAAVDCRDLFVRYGDVEAVRGLSLSVAPGRIVALLGPNGAGKTSTVETLEGYRRPSSGLVRVLGLDPVKQHKPLVTHIGVMLQRCGVYPTMTAGQVLELFSRFYVDPEDPKSLLARVGLTGVARTPWRRLSGGEQQRLSLSLALVGKPRVLFLDEPTAGVDPEGRIAVRQVISEQRDLGTAILLTTHELPEAEHLADEVVIINHGRAAARGGVVELAAKSGGGRIEFKAVPGMDISALASSLEVDESSVSEGYSGRYAVDAPATAARVAALAKWLADRDLPLEDLRAGQRSLEDAYLQITRSGSFEAESNGSTPGSAEHGSQDDPRPGPGTDLDPGRERDPRVAIQRLLAQTRAEISMTLQRGESLLLTIGIPVVLLAFFSEVHLLPLGTSHPVGFLAPGILALAVMGTALVNLSIATGFERGYGVLKRLGSTPLGRPSLLGSKIASVLVVEVLQAVVLVAVALALGWHAEAGGTGAAIGVALLGTCGFAGLGLLLAGVLRAEVNLAAANGLWLVLLLVSGMLAPLSKLPVWLEDVSKVLPAAALAQGLHDSLSAGISVPLWSWAVLACWALAAPGAAALTFRWE